MPAVKPLLKRTPPSAFFWPVPSPIKRIERELAQAVRTAFPSKKRNEHRPNWKLFDPSIYDVV